jgi:hypothetical protein
MAAVPTKSSAPPARRPVNDAALLGVDLVAALLAERAINKKLSTAIGIMAMGSVLCIFSAIGAFSAKPQPDRIAVGPNHEVFSIQMMANMDPPDSKVTAFVGECMDGLLNGAFHNFQSTVGATIDRCFTGGGAESARHEIDPFLLQMKKDQMNLASLPMIMPFIDSRPVVLGRGTYKVQGTYAVGFRGTNSSTRPIEYAYEATVVHVPYESNVFGIRIESVTMKQRNNT